MLRFFLFFCYIIFFCNLAFASNLTKCHDQRCVLVVDAGSTSSKLHIYHIQNNNIEELYFKKTAPGLGNIQLDKVTINNYLNEVFSIDINAIIPVYFYSTAGMRLHPFEVQANYYKLIAEWFSKQNNFELKDVRTISGSEEGVFGWLAVNYNLGNMNTENYAAVLDMGGASVEITFPVQNLSNIPENNLYKVNLGKSSVTLYSQSFLGLGQTLLMQQFLNEESCFPNEYVLANGLPAQGNAFNCQSSISKLVNLVHNVNQQIPPILARNPQNNWFTIGGLENILNEKFYTWEEKNTGNMSNLLNKTNELICQHSWSQLISKFSDVKYLYASCLLPSYYYALIVDGYGISPYTNIHFPDTNNSWDWTLGVLLKNTYQ